MTANTMKRTQCVLHCVRSYAQEHGYAPTLREIAEHCGGLSTSVVHYHIVRLRDRGELAWHPRTARGIVIPHHEKPTDDVLINLAWDVVDAWDRDGLLGEAIRQLRRHLEATAIR